MTPRRLLILSALALLVIAGALWLSSQRQLSRSADLYAPLYPALKSEINAVNTIRIFKAGEARAVELRRAASGWTVSEHADYAADSAKVRKLLLGLAQAKVLEEKTSNPQNYAELGVEDVSGAAASGVRVELSGLKQPVNLIVGKPGAGADLHYVRRVGEPQSGLIDTQIDASVTADDWLHREIMNIPTERIQSATVAIQGASPYTAARNARADEDLTIDALPRNRKLSSPSAANGLTNALTVLTLVHVHPAGQFNQGDPAAQATFKTFDGLVVNVQGWKKNDQRYIAIKSRFDSALAARFQVAAAPAEATGKTPAAPPAADAAPPSTASTEAEASSLNAALGAWVYEIPQYKYEVIFRPLEEMVEKK